MARGGSERAYFPASGKAGGTANLGRAGEGGESRGGVGSRVAGPSDRADLLGAGGGGGAGDRFGTGGAVTVSETDRCAAAGGGGGGALRPVPGPLAAGGGGGGGGDATG